MVSADIISKTWIENIKKLDSKNRLAHGEIYSKDGSIKNLEIDNNTVKSKVEGAPGDIYDVEIIFNEFTNNQKNFFNDLIKNNPHIYSKLLNLEIPEEILNNKIRVFPISIKDFKMRCSCNKGLFCKHKAATFHKLAHEIQKDPFLIFSLQGFDLKKLISNTSSIKKIENVLKNKNEVVLNDGGGIDYLTKMNFILSDYPSFYPSQSVNFNEVLYNTLSAMPRCIRQINNSKNRKEFNEFIILGNTLRSFEYFASKSQAEIKNAFENKWLNPQKWEQFKIDINGDYEISKIDTGNYSNNFIRENLKFPLFAFFAELNQIDIYRYCEDIKFLHEVYLFTSKLIYLNSLIPEFFQLDNEEFHIRWIPAFESGIYGKLQELYDKCSNKSLTFCESELSAENQVNALISLFFEGFCVYYISKSLPHNLSSFKNELHFRLFFIKSQDLIGYRYEDSISKIDDWLSALYLKQNDYSFILNTIQSDYEFVLELKIQLDDKLLDFNDIVDLKRFDIVKNISIVESIFEKSGMEFDFVKNPSMDLREYSWFLNNVAPNLNLCGIKVNPPNEFEDVKELKLVLSADSNNPTASLTLDDLVDFDWKIAIGDETFSIDDLESFNHNFKGLIKIKDKYFVVSEENLNQLRKDIGNIPEKRDKISLLNYLLSSSSDNVEMDNKLNELIDSVLEVEEVNVPTSLNGTLRSYQETGFSWMYQNMQLGFGSILADDMGLGKTIQILTLILHLKENNDLNDEKVLIVAPTSILTNWAMEIEKFAPSLNVEIYHGMKRKFPYGEYDILLTSYGMVRQDIKKFAKENWFLIVIDEAQNIKNPKTKQTKAVKFIKAKHQIALSGTPIENHLGEYWSIFDFTNKGYLSSLKNFKKRFIKPIEKERNREVLNDFRKITSPFILRRLKTDEDIVKELPDKIINDIYCNLTLKQATMYDEALEVLIQDVEESEGIQRKGLVLKLINALKQICNHPSQFLKIDDAKISESGKMEVLMNILETIIESDEKVLIFTQYVQMGEILQKLIAEKFSEEVLFLHGGVPRTKRDEMIDKFQNGKPKIFILSLKAGGIGLNLTAAQNVIHYDLWWNPAVENQATDRAYRIGQKENVMVYRFITKGTLEERINKILEEKRELVDMTIGSEESFITEMDNNELREMLTLRNEIND